MGLDEDDDAAKSIKQLGLLSLMPVLDRELMKEASARLMEWIVRGEDVGKRVRMRRHHHHIYLKHFVIDCKATKKIIKFGSHRSRRIVLSVIPRAWELDVTRGS